MPTYYLKRLINPRDAHGATIIEFPGTPEQLIARLEDKPHVAPPSRRKGKRSEKKGKLRPNSVPARILRACLEPKSTSELQALLPGKAISQQISRLLASVYLYKVPNSDKKATTEAGRAALLEHDNALNRSKQS